MASHSQAGPAHDTVFVIDFGAQYSQLIARRVRECNVYCELWPHTASLDDLLARNPKGFILSGGPASVYGERAPGFDARLFAAGLPILGICYGMQYMAHALGGRVAPAERREYGHTPVAIQGAPELFAGFAGEDGRADVWMSHGDHVMAPPPGFEVIAGSADLAVAAMADRAHRLYAVQFHPEVAHTPGGLQLFRNFLLNICGCNPTWTMANFVETAVAEIRARVQDGNVLCALSGGVDSSVAAALVHRAVGDRLTSIFIDHGFMRKGEPEQVERTFRGRFGPNLVHVEAAARFWAGLEGVADPETKRKRIGETFIRVFEAEARKVGGVRYLVQGTLYPDVIESGLGASAVIKSHHNVGGLPAEMELDLIEPLRLLFKDEVRALGRELGLPHEIVGRQPFPGPGLAIRVMGPLSRERVEIARACDHIVVDEIRKAGLYDDVWQSFAVLTDTRTVGVMGDQRTYGYLVGVRAVAASDGMTADWYPLPAAVLRAISGRIIGEVEQVNRVVYDISSKPPATIEWE